MQPVALSPREALTQALRVRDQMTEGIGSRVGKNLFRPDLVHEGLEDCALCTVAPVAGDLRRGHAAQLSESPSAPNTSGPPQDPLRQRESKSRPTAIASITIPMTRAVKRKRNIYQHSTLACAVQCVCNVRSLSGATCHAQCDVLRVTSNACPSTLPRTDKAGRPHV